MQNYTVRPILWHYQKNKAEIYPVKIAVTVDRKVTYLMTPHRVHKDDWQESKVIRQSNAKLINADIRQRISEVEKRLISKSISGGLITKGVITGSRVFDITFASYAAEVRLDKKEINRLANFSGRGTLMSEIDVAYLRKFEAHERARGMSNNTVNSTFKYLHRIIAQAKAEGVINDNPFDDYDVPRFKQTERIYLIETERQQLLELFKEDLPEHLYRTLCFFLLGCYSGLRHSDWLRFDASKMVEDGFLKLRAKKNNVSVVLPIGPTLENVIERVRSLKKPPFSNQKCNEKLKLLAILAKIKKPISTHTGRHSFGYLCASNRLPKSVTAELLGVSAQTVEVYYHLSGENIVTQAEVLRTL